MIQDTFIYSLEVREADGADTTFVLSFNNSKR